MAERTVEERRVREDGSLIFQIVEKDGWGSMPVTKQKIINAFNFPFTLNPGSGCLYKCSYCFLKIPFFARHLGSAPHTEMNFKAGFTDKLSSSFGQLPSRSPHQIRTWRFPPSGSSVDTARDYGPHNDTTIRGLGSGKSRSRSTNRSSVSRVR